MSLDIDLYAVTLRDGHEKASCQQREAFGKILDVVGLTPFTPADSIPHCEVKLHIADWNHAYQIWRWFTDHIQEGVACREETPVDRKTLEELHDLCKRLLVRRRRKEAEAALPLPADLFEDKTEEDEYWRDAYWHDVKSTVQQLGPILANPKFSKNWEFIYKFG